MPWLRRLRPDPRRAALPVALAAALGAGAACGAPPSPEEALRGALAAMDAPGLRSGSGFRAHASGRLDKAVEGQGVAPGVSSPGPYVETLAVGPGSVAWEYREERFDGTRESLRWIFPTDSQRVLALPDLGIAIPEVGGDWAEARRALERRLPQLLVAEVLERPGALARATGRDGGDGREAFAARFASGRSVTLVLGDDGRLARAEVVDTLPARGARTVAWWWDDWRPVEGLGVLPFARGIEVDGDAYLEVRTDSVRVGVGDLMEPPAGLRALPERRADPPEPDAPDAPDAPPALALEEVGPGLFVGPGVRSGFDPLVVVFDSFVVAVDAPASFPLLGEMPPGETDPGPNLSWSSERYVDAVRERFPDRPLRWVVLTHHHEDHGGGLRAFVAEGATVLAPPSARPGVEALLAVPPGEAGDRYARAPRPLRFEAVEERRVLESGGRRLELLNTGPNPHHDGMLVAWLPEEGVMFVSDMLTPGRLDAYPRASHAALDRWFVAWLDREGLAPRVVHTMHGAGPATPAHLARVREEGSPGGR